MTTSDPIVLDPVALEFLTDQEVGHLGVIDENVPYVTPLSFVVVDEVVMFRTAEGRRLDAILKSPRVCLEVSEVEEGTEEWFSAIAWGDARIADTPQGDVCRQALTRKYEDSYWQWPPNPAPDEFSAGSVVVVFAIDELTSATSSGFMRPTLRPGRL